jgi:hypothetical protein
MARSGDALRRQAAARERASARAITGAATRARARVPVDPVRQRIAEQRVDEATTLATRAWDAETPALQRTLGRQLRDAQEAGAAVAERTAGLVGRFDVTNPESVRWAQTRAATLVTEVSRETRAAIRQVITRGILQGVAPIDTARALRDVIGLTTRQESALQAFRASLLRLRQRPEGWAVETPLQRLSNRGLTMDRVRELVARYADRLLGQRAWLIARTETMAALNEGQRQLWAQAGDELDGMERTWLVTDDERLCELCAPLDGERADLEGQYPEGGGAGPPRHPNCRCTEGLVATRGLAAA